MPINTCIYPSDSFYLIHSVFPDAGDTVDVIEKLDSGWWFVSVGGEQGFVPCSYLEKEGEEDEDDAIFVKFEKGKGEMINF